MRRFRLVYMARATDASRDISESAREVNAIGMRAPTTNPAHSPPPTYTKLLYSRLPEFQSGTTMRSKSPAQRELTHLVLAASTENALSKPNDPSTIAPGQYPTRPMRTNSRASTVAGIAGLSVSTAAMIRPHSVLYILATGLHCKQRSASKTKESRVQFLLATES